MSADTVALYIKTSSLTAMDKHQLRISTEKLIEDLASGKSVDELIVALSMNLQAGLHDLAKALIRIIDKPEKLSEARIFNNQVSPMGIGLLYTAWKSDRDNSNNMSDPNKSLLQLLLQNGVRLSNDERDLMTASKDGAEFLRAYDKLSSPPAATAHTPDKRR